MDFRALILVLDEVSVTIFHKGVTFVPHWLAEQDPANRFEAEICLPGYEENSNLNIFYNLLNKIVIFLHVL